MHAKLSFYLIGWRHGFRMSEVVKLVENSEKWTQGEWEEYHRTKLKAMVEHAYNHVPFYRKEFDKLNLKPVDIQSLQDLHKLPIIRKQDIREHLQEFMADNVSKKHKMHHHTGGTTGKPTEYYNDYFSWALNWALKMRTFEKAGYIYGKDELAVMAGGSLIPKKEHGLKHNIWRWVNKYYSIPISHFSFEDLQYHTEQIIKRKIKFLRGYPSAIGSCAEYLLSQQKIVPLKAVFTTAEMLLPHQRKAIEQAFQCNVWDMYGCGDGMGFAAECKEHNGLHIRQENSIMQVVDENGLEVKEGEIGEVVLTALNDFGMPLIRYAPGDKVVKGAEGCRCGVQTPMIERVLGRTSDVFKLKNGRILNGLALPFEDVPKQVEQFQIVQEATDKVVLKIVPGKDYSETIEHDFLKVMQYHCGEGIEVSVQIVNSIPVPESGKYRYVISNVQ